MEHPIALVVEDEMLIAVDLADTIASAGYTVEIAQDGETALAFVRKNPAVKAAVIDLQLRGDLSGEELIGRIRKTHPDMAICVVTGADGADVPDDIPILKKPFPNEDLLEVLPASSIFKP